MADDKDAAAGAPAISVAPKEDVTAIPPVDAVSTAKDAESPSKKPAGPPPKEARSPPKEATSPPKEVASSPREAAQEPDNGILPASHWAGVPLPAEPVFDDHDSAYGDDIDSTASLSASILQYRTLHGRTFHSDMGKAESWVPNDEKQQESMDIHHHMCTLALGDRLFLAPINDDIQKVLDIGTGTGVWAIDFADAFPGAEVIGTDLSPIQPSWVPPNVTFQIDDANLQWTWPDCEFDFIHMRALFGSIVDWAALYREAFRCCKPGGYFEDMENSVSIESDDGSVAPGSPFDEWGKVFRAGGDKFGRTFRVLEDDIQRKCMEEAGFVDITIKDIKCPIGSWPADARLRTLGTFAKMVLETDAEGYVLYMWSAVMGWSPEEIQVYLAHLRRQLRDRNIHAWYRQRVVYGRKPE